VTLEWEASPMSYPSLVPVAAVAALLSMDITNAAAQFAYVPPGGIYVGAPGYDYGYGAGCGGYGAQKALAAPGVREKLAQQGMDPMPITPAAFDAQIRREIDSILALAKAANLKFN
jgi:hypothetical protein